MKSYPFLKFLLADDVLENKSFVVPFGSVETVCTVLPAVKRNHIYFKHKHYEDYFKLSKTKYMIVLPPPHEWCHLGWDKKKLQKFQNDTTDITV